ncbi:alanine racemase [Burkholderia plantarii]|uniref:alanine racemase n=1 Tax=Burkholderia plantarii TaxID=41899 RepID=UPI0006D8B6B2|nr:alanine racemase [Burkholderia plantarii]ALK33306.1 Orn/DAP/Arg decarboxylase 2:Orn/DAP/Arg decarboxylase 2 [Burkholderia plantarii]GLZ22293.1 decarboxylase [Burkholderia plantarii]
MNLGKYFSTDAPDTFYTIDRDWITRNARLFGEQFAGRVLYAVKANPLPEVLDALARGGVTHFDVASLEEVSQVARAIPGATQYLMNPVKSRHAIDVAYRNHGVRAFVVDSETELRKVRDVLPSSDADIMMYVRYAPSESGAVFDLRGKFGAAVGDAAALVETIGASTRWGVGLSFHVGSQAVESAPYLTALQDAERIVGGVGTRVRSLDVGGGFPGVYLNSSSDTAALLASINTRIEASPALRQLDLICEAGRGLVYGGMSLFARVLLRRDADVFCGAGIFGGLLSAQQWLQFPLRVWRHGEPYEGGEQAAFQLFGPTCDSMDRLAFPYSLPADVNEGDWLEFQSVGAYSVSVRAPFNGFYADEIVDVSR